MSFVFGVHVRDIDCAFKIFRADFFRTNRLETRGAMINAEILYKFARAGYTSTEVGVQHLPRRAGKATGAKLSVIFRALRELFIYAEQWRKEEQQLLFYHSNNSNHANNSNHVYENSVAIPAGWETKPII